MGRPTVHERDDLYGLGTTAPRCMILVKVIAEKWLPLLLRINFAFNFFE